MTSQLKTSIVDSFTHEPFKGNPAGVCLSDKPLEASRMQAIASELNLSETAFVVQSDARDRYSIRYFSPKMEIPLCGHATLAAAKVLFETAKLKQIEFTTVDRLKLSIGLSCDRIEMEFPVYDLHDAPAPDSLLTAIGITSVEYCGYNEETRILMLEISSTKDLAGLRPDFNALLKSHGSINGVLVTARADDGFDFHSRYFWPWSGTNEDPVTGGTHTFLAKYWGHKLGK
jgi:PhzF family phenazine biosynthesis protein